MTTWNPDAVAPPIGDVYRRERSTILTINLVLRAIALGGILTFALMPTSIPS